MQKFAFLFAFIFLISLWSCGSDSDSNQQTGAAQQSQQSGDLTEWELEHGIGPIKSKIELGAVDKAMAEQGAKIFEMKCTACHKLDERYVGPLLRNVTKRRNPEFIMNQILNPDENVKRHPEGKKMLAEYLAPMTNMNLTEEDARAVLEYLRFEEN